MCGLWMSQASSCLKVRSSSLHLLIIVEEGGSILSAPYLLSCNPLFRTRDVGGRILNDEINEETRAVVAAR